MTALRVVCDSKEGLSAGPVEALLMALRTEGIELNAAESAPIGELTPSTSALLIHYQAPNGKGAWDFMLAARKCDPSRVAIVAVGDPAHASLLEYENNPHFLDDRFLVADLTEWRGDHRFARFRGLVGICRRLTGQTNASESSVNTLAQLRKRAENVQSTISRDEQTAAQARTQAAREATAAMVKRQVNLRPRHDLGAGGEDRPPRPLGVGAGGEDIFSRQQASRELSRSTVTRSALPAQRLNPPEKYPPSFQTSPASRHRGKYAAILLAGAAVVAAYYWRQDLVDWVGSILSGFGLVKGATPPLPGAREEPLAQNLVEASIFTPPNGRPDEDILVQVFLHRLSDAAIVQSLAQEPDESAKRRDTKTLAVEMAIGTRVDFVLDAPGLIVRDGFADNSTAQYLIWRGVPESCKFLLGVSPKASGRAQPVTVRLFVNGTAVGKLQFMLKIDDALHIDPVQISLTTATRFKRAFLSYSSADRVEVLKYAYALKAARISFFHDLLEIKAGSEWEKRLIKEIDECDLFLLFWSSNAARSDWVLRETLRALGRREASSGEVPDITPIILEGPPVPKPPEPLRHLHFNDAIRYVIAACEMERSLKLDPH
jgi:TIR domain-containing protein